MAAPISALRKLALVALKNELKDMLKDEIRQELKAEVLTKVKAEIKPWKTKISELVDWCGQIENVQAFVKK